MLHLSNMHSNLNKLSPIIKRSSSDLSLHVLIRVKPSLEFWHKLQQIQIEVLGRKEEQQELNFLMAFKAALTRLQLLGSRLKLCNMQ